MEQKKIILPKLHSGQLEIIKTIFKSDCFYYVMNCSRQSGKEQPYSSLVYTIEGEKLFGDLKIGDMIFNENRELTTILNIFEQGEKDVYEIELKDGRKFRTGLNHLNSVYFYHSRKNHIITTGELLSKPLTKIRQNGLSKGKEEYLYFIETSKGVEFNKKDFFIEPYLLGCLICDGCLGHNTKSITIKETEMFDYINLPENYYFKHIPKYDYRINQIKQKNISPFRLEIERLNLNHNCIDKRIPKEYKYSSYEQRLELLKGLMDTDSTISKKGSPEFYSISYKLCEDVKWLVESLGGVAKIYKGENHKSYRVRIFIELNIFKLQYKSERTKLNKFFNHSKKQAIVSVKKLDYKEKCRCIMVDNPTHLYLTDNFIPTHNTFMLEWLMLYHALKNNNNKLYFVSPFYSQAKKSFNSLLLALSNTGLIKKQSLTELEFQLQNDTTLYFKSADNFDGLRGISPQFLFIDEFAFMKQDAWRQVLKPALSVSGKRCYIASTPRTKQSDFYQMFIQGQDEKSTRYKSFHMTYKDNPLANIEEVNDAMSNLPEVIFNAEFLAEFIDSGGEVFRNIDECAILNLTQTPDTYYAGIDLGRQNDYTVLTIMNQNKEVVFMYRENHKDWNIIITNLALYLKKFNVKKAFVELNNIGDVVFDMLKKEVGSVIDGSWTGKNKSDLIEALIIEFENQTLHIPKKTIYSELYNELSIYTYEYNIKSRTIKYGAPQGMHDDCVMSLAICLDCFNKYKLYNNKPTFYSLKQNNEW